jgi:hypothetical protein
MNLVKVVRIIQNNSCFAKCMYVCSSVNKHPGSNQHNSPILNFFVNVSLFFLLFPKYFNSLAVWKNFSAICYYEFALFFFVMSYEHVQYLQGVSFIAASNTAALSHRKPVSAGIFLDSCGGRDGDYRNHSVVLATFSCKLCYLLISNRFSVLYGIFVFTYLLIWRNLMSNQ